MQDDKAFPASEEAFRLIVETIPRLVAVMTPTGEVEHVNGRVLEYFGRTLEELKRWGSADALHPEDRPTCSLRGSTRSRLANRTTSSTASVELMVSTAGFNRAAWLFETPKAGLSAGTTC